MRNEVRGMIFISYSSKDYNAALAIKGMLVENNLDCWMAPESIPMGGDYSSEIPDAIESCDVFLLILSMQSQISNWVPKELDLAITYNKPIIPFQIDNGMITKPFNFRLSNVQRIEAFHNLEVAYKRLMERVKMETKDVRSDKVKCGLPEKYSYYQLLGVNDISQISIAEIRDKNDVTSSLSVPIGINSNNETVHLNLHQKYDGPHGMIIGPVGSGKSEFLITLCLSLCLFFSPEEVRLHIVDQKGGGMAHEMKGLPHLGASLCDSSCDSVNEFIRSIEEEIARRYMLLEKYAVSNMYQYQKLRKTSLVTMEPMPHLIIVLDEMAFLKREQPDVFQTITSWGNRMNATLLGIHIVFSTQAPYGIIDDTIWNMSDFRICSTKQRPETVSESASETSVSTCPGRLYMQSRSKSEIQLIQLAYCDTDASQNSIDLSRYEWFFQKKSQKNEIIDMIMRYELD